MSAKGLLQVARYFHYGSDEAASYIKGLREAIKKRVCLFQQQIGN